MTLVVTKKNTHAMTLVDPWVVCEVNTHAMTLVIHMWYVKITHMQNNSGCCYLKEHTCNDTSGSMCGLYREHTFQ